MTYYNQPSFVLSRTVGDKTTVHSAHRTREEAQAALADIDPQEGYSIIESGTGYRSRTQMTIRQAMKLLEEAGFGPVGYFGKPTDKDGHMQIGRHRIRMYEFTAENGETHLWGVNLNRPVSACLDMPPDGLLQVYVLLRRVQEGDGTLEDFALAELYATLDEAKQAAQDHEDDRGDEEDFVLKWTDDCCAVGSSYDYKILSGTEPDGAKPRELPTHD